jgi:hypothetical protein
MLSSFSRPLCWFVQAWFPMTRKLAVVVAAATVVADFMAVAPASHTSEAVPFTPDGSALPDAATDTDRYLVVRSHARRCVEGPIALRIVGLGAERPTAPQRSVLQPPALLTTAATTTTAATAIPTAIGSAQISIEAPRGGGPSSGLAAARFVRAALADVMESLTQHPLLTFAAVFMALWFASVAGAWLHRRNPKAEEEEHEDLGIILGATLTLLALIIGFSVSMASTRYDQRKNLEEAEANAIGTEMLRSDLLPPADAAKVRELLGAYLDQRIQFYINQDDSRQAQIDQATSQLQISLWAAVRGVATGQPTPVVALVLAGMNDVINSQGYTQAAFWNRIPRAVWWLMATIALCSNLLFGYRARDCKAARKLALVLPFVVSTAFLLIADIDAPRHGLIKVSAQNLESLAKSLER